MNNSRLILRVSVAVALMMFFQSVANSADFFGPVISLPQQEVLEKSSPSYQISAKVSDDNGIESVVLHYRTIGSNDRFRDLNLIPSRSDGFYSAVIPGAHLEHPGIEYYIEAEDHAGNRTQQPSSDSPKEIFFEEAINVAREEEKSASGKKWWWIALGVLAAGALVAASDDGGSDGGGATLNVEAPTP